VLFGLVFGGATYRHQCCSIIVMRQMTGIGAAKLLLVVLVVFTPTLHAPSRSLTEQQNQHLSGKLQPVQMRGTASRVCAAPGAAELFSFRTCCWHQLGAMPQLAESLSCSAPLDALLCM
jgi:hypothetical protein